MRLIDSLTYKPVELGFGTSGLRGLVSDMTDLECFINTTGFLQFLEQYDGLKKGEKIYIAGDLRDSTPHIMQVVAQACQDNDLEVINCGLIPTPAAAHYALNRQAACIVVTGSHIPAVRNGIKFYKRGGEVIKEDEAAIQAAVASIRTDLYQSDNNSAFSAEGSLNKLAVLPEVDIKAETEYIDRFLGFFAPNVLSGKKVIVYQQSAVGRDILVEILNKLGANAVPIERSDKFIPIDTENVTDEEKTRFKSFADKFPDAFAIVSTDGDSDRPFVIDETGIFHRGDVLGCVVMEFLGAKFAATPISSNDAVDTFADYKGIEMVHTKIGSPFVIVAMDKEGPESKPIVGWEVNGGFLTGSEIIVDNRTLSPLPTRDAILPILCALISAANKNQKVSDLFAALPQRFTGGGLIDNILPNKIKAFRTVCSDQERAEQLMQTIFSGTKLGRVKSVNLTDGLRLIFEPNEVIHLRPSGNAPQFRVYTNADSQTRADELVEQAVRSDGYIETLLNNL